MAGPCNRAVFTQRGRERGRGRKRGGRKEEREGERKSDRGIGGWERNRGTAWRKPQREGGRFLSSEKPREGCQVQDRTACAPLGVG